MVGIVLGRGIRLCVLVVKECINIGIEMIILIIFMILIVGIIFSSCRKINDLYYV